MTGSSTGAELFKKYPKRITYGHLGNKKKFFQSAIIVNMITLVALLSRLGLVDGGPNGSVAMWTKPTLGAQ
jgi:hypothetical protein